MEDIVVKKIESCEEELDRFEKLNARTDKIIAEGDNQASLLIGLALGTILGLVGNLIISLLYDIALQGLPLILKGVLLVLSIILMFLVLQPFIKRYKALQESKVSLEYRRSQALEQAERMREIVKSLKKLPVK